MIFSLAQPHNPQILFWLGTDLAGWGILFLLAVGPTVAGFGLINVSLSLLPASITNLVLSSEPVFTTVIAYFLLDERMSIIQIVGSLLIMGGVIFLRIYEGSQMIQKDAQPVYQEPTA